MVQKKEEVSGGWAGPALFIAVSVAMVAFFFWFL